MATAGNDPTPNTGSSQQQTGKESTAPATDAGGLQHTFVAQGNGTSGTANAGADAGGLQNTFLSHGQSQQNAGINPFANSSVGATSTTSESDDSGTIATSFGVSNQLLSGLGAGVGISFGAQGAVNSGVETAVTFVNEFNAGNDQETKVGGGNAIGFGNSGAVNAGIGSSFQVGYGNQGNVQNGLATTVSYGNQGATNIGFTTAVGTVSLTVTTTDTVIVTPPPTPTLTPPPPPPVLTADLSVTFSVAPSAAVPGEGNAEVYTLHIANAGPATVTSLSLSDTLFTQLTPSAVTVPLGSAFNATTGVLSGISLGTGQSIDFAVTGTLTPGGTATGSVTDTATVQPLNVTDSNPANNTATSTLALNPVADLAVNFVSTPTNAVPGQSSAESYALQVTNNGPSTVTSITLTDSLMSQLTNAHFTLPAGSSFNATTGVLSGVSLASGQSLTFGISGTLSPGSTATGTIIDTATVEPVGVPDNTQANNTATSTVVLNPAADLAISFTSAPTGAVPGQSSTESYTLQVTNNGPSTVTSITLTDSLLTQLTNAHFTLPAGSSFNATTGVLSGISLSTGQSLSFGISGTLTPVATATGNIIDTATAEPVNATDLTQTNNTATSAVDLHPVADLAISYTTAPTNAVPGQTNAEAYTFQITNTGPSTVTSLTLTDALLSQLANAHFTLPAGSSFNAATGVLSGISLGSGQSLSFGIAGTLTPAATATGNIVDTATVEPVGATDRHQANNTATSTLALNPAADLAINFTAAPGNAVPGQANTETYTLQVTNNGPSTVTSITLTDSLLTQLTNAHFTLPAGSSFNATTGVLSGVSLGAGQSLSFGISGTYTPLATDTGHIVDTATVEPVNATDAVQANNSATSTNGMLNPMADLAINFTSAPESVVPGQANSESYTLQVTNNGPSTVTSITLTDSLLTQLTNAHFTLPAGSSFNAVTGVLSGISLGTGQSLSFGVSGTLSPVATATGNIVDTATVEPVGANDTVQSNNTATSAVTLNPASDLAVSFSTAPESAVPGQANTENYTLQVTNSGPSTVTSITLTDSLLTQLTNAHFTLPAGSSFNATTGVLSGISLGTGQSLSFGIAGTLNPVAAATGNIVDTATVEPVGSTDSNQTNNTATSALPLNPVADLAISFATTPQSAIPGQANAEHYSLLIQNNGPSTVTSITLTDSLLAQLSNASVTLPTGSSFNAATGVLSGVSLASGQSLTFGISGIFTPSGNQTGTVIDTATVADPSGVSDPDLVNNATTSAVTLNPVADLAINFSSTPANAIPGQANTESYTLQVTNSGPSTVTSITLTDSLLAQLTNAHFTLPAGSTFNAVTGVLSGISLATGQSLSLGISGTLSPVATATGNVVDTATVEPVGATDSNQANNAATSTIALNPTADLAVSFANTPENAIPGQATAESYTLQVTNNGPSTVSSITLTDSFMSQLTNAHFTLPAGATYDATTGVLSGITLASGQSLSFGIAGTYTPAGTATGTVTDTVSVSDPSGVADPNTANNTATSNIALNPTADLAVSFVTGPQSAEPGQATAESYTLQVTNNGPSTVTSITLTDSFMTQLTNAHFTLPAGSTFNAVTGVLSGITLASGQSLSFGIAGTYTPAGTATGTVIDTATVADPSGVADPNTANNTATSNIALNPTADLAVSFASTPQNAIPGQATAESYTLQVTNNGPSTVSSIILTDSFMSQLTNAHFTLPTGATYDATTGVLSGITLASGQSLSFGIAGTYTPAGTATGTVTDTVSVSDPSGVADPNTANNTATSNIALNPTADLAVSFVTGPQSAEPGQATAESYTLQVTNNGPSTVTSITLTDSFMTQLTNAHFTLPAGSTFNAVTGVLSGITLASGQSLSFGIAGTYTPAGTATGTVIDTATVADPSGVADPNTANNTATSNIALNPTADLAVSFASTPQNAIPGQATAESYTLQVTNNGPSTVSSITLTDSFMSQLTNAHFTLPAGATYDATTGVLSGITLASGQSLSFGIAGTYTPAGTATGTVTDTVSVSDPSGVADPNTANNTATSNIALNPTADLAVSFVTGPQSAEPGQATAESYTLQVTNNGPSTVTSITLTDSFMTQLTNAHFTLPAGSTFNAVTGVLSGITLASGQSLSFGIAGTYTPAGTATGTVIDTATVADPSGVADPNTANNTATSNIALNPTADLAVSFTTAPQSAEPGQATAENYTLQVTNNGPSTLTNITLTDSFLAQLTNAHFTLPTGATYNATTGVLSGITLASGQSLSFGIAGTYTPTGTATGTVTDTVSVSDPSGVADPNTANNTATSNIALNPTADLAVSFVTGPQSAEPGQATAESYTLQVTNNGPSTVTSITLTDSFMTQLTNAHFTLPAGSTFNAVTGVLSGITLASGQSLSFGIAGTYTPAGTATGMVIDTATVADPSGVADPNTANNTATSNIALNPTADLAVSFASTPQNAIPGQATAESYTLQVTNNGPSTVSSITLTDSFMSQLTNAHFTLPTGATYDATTGVLSGITLASGQSLSFGIAGTYTPAGTATGTVTDTVSVSDPSGVADPNTANNTATSNIALNPTADLAVSFVTGPQSAEPGQATAESYTLQVTNNGPSTVTSITLTDSFMTQLTNAHFTLPAGSTFNAVTGVLSGITLASGQSLSFGIAGTYTPAGTATGTVIDTATVADPSGVADPNTANNTATSNIALNPTADLAVSFTTAPQSAEPGQATAENYTLQVTNNGPSTVSSITLTDSFMSQLTNAHFTLPAGATYDATTGVLSGITLASGQSLSFGIAGTYTPAGTATGTVTDTVSVSDPSGVADPNTANNTATSNIALNPTADLAVSFVTGPQSAEPGQATAESYTLQVTNNGPSTVTSITLTDSFMTQLTNAHFTLPAGSTFNAVTGVLSGITLASGQSLSFGIAGTYTPAGTATGTVIDTATVADPSGVADPNTANNTATSNIALNPTADLAVSFTTAPQSAEPGQATAENYTLQVTNNGPSTVSSITLTDSFMSQLTNAHFTLPAGATYDATTGVLSGITLASGQSLSFGIAGTYTPAGTATGTVTDTVSVSDPSGVADPNTANNTATSNIALNPTADLAVSFVTGPQSAEPGQAMAESYTLQVTNNGPSTVTSITLTDSFMTQLTNAHFTLPAGSTFNAVTGVLSGITLASGQSLSFGIAGTYTPAGTATGTVIDTATVADPSGVADPNTANNTATSNIALNPTADLAVSFASTPENAIPGQATAESYTLQVTNNGPSTVTSITLTDSFMTQLTNAHFTLPTGATYDATTGVLSGITLASGQSLSFGIAGTYTPAGTATGTVTDTVSVSDPSGVADPNTANNTATSNIALNPTADLAVSFVTGPQSAEPGQATAESYTLQVTNNGPSTVTSITLTDSFMTQLTNAHFTLPAGSTFNAVTGVLSGITLTSGQSLSFGIAGTYTPAGTATGTVIDTATVADPSGVADPNTANNTATSNIALNPTADLAVSFTTAPQSAEPGQATAENYTLQVTNNGPSTLTNITLTDSFLAQLINAHFTLPTGATYNATTGVLSGITLASGQSLSFGIAGTYTPTGTATGTVTDTVSVSDPSGVTDPNTVNNMATSTIALNPTADLAVSFTTAPQNAIPGQATAENYTLQVTNNGPSTVTSITLTDSFMSQLTNSHFTLPAGASYNATTGVLSGISLAAGQSLSFGVSGTYTPSATATGTVTDTATVTDPGGVTDPSTANNTVTSNIVLNPTADLAVSFATAPQSAEPGQATAENYTLQVTNNGPSTVTSITLTDSFLAQLTNAHFALPAGASYNATTGVLSGISLAMGQSLSFGIAGTYTPSATATGIVTDTATVADPSGVTDPVSTNNAATSTVTLNPTADLSVSYTTPPQNVIPGQANTENYTLQITNNGPSTVTSMTISDSLLAQLTSAHFTLPAGASYNATTGVLSGISLAAGQSLSFGISGTYTPSATSTGTVTDTATVTDPSGVVDPNTVNNTVSSTFNLTPTADLAISYATAPQSAIPGQANTENYTLQVTNNGPSTVTSITLTDSFLAQLTNSHLTLPTGSTFNAATGVLSGISLASGQSLTFGISGTYTPAATATGTIIDTATVADPGGVTDPNTANNTVTGSVTLNPQAALAVTITPSQTVFVAGATETYTITLKNTGPSVAYNVSMLDTLASQGLLNITSPNLPSGVTFNATTDTWSIGMLAVGATDTFQLTGTIPSGATGSSYTDQVTASASDAASVSAQSSIIPSGIIIAEPDVDTVSVSVGSTTAANVITGADSNPHPGSALSADIIDAYGGAHILSIGFGSQTQSFSIPADVHTDSQGQSYIALTGTYGVLDMYENGNYIYTVTSVPASTTGSAVTVGSTTEVSSSSVMQSDWAGAGLYAYNFGTPYVNSAGEIALSQANGQLTYNTGGIGVNGYEANHSDAQPVAQIKYDPVDDQSQALAVDLGTSATKAVVTVDNLFSNEATGEQGLWQAFTSSGVEIGQGLLNTSTINYGSSVDMGTATIQVLGANGQAIPFEYIVFTALPYPSAPTNFNDGITTDSSDYFVTGIQYTPAPTTPNLQDVFTYTEADSNNDQSSTTLTVKGETADLAVAVVNNLQTAIASQTDSYTITVTNNGPATVTSLNLTDATLSGLNSYNQFVTYLQNPVLTPASGTFNSSTGAWTGLSLASGQSITLTVSGTVNAAATGELINTVTVADTTAGLVDPSTANNSAESVVAITPAINSLSITQTDSAAVIEPGTANSSEVYTITVTNTSGVTATNVSVSDLLPGGITFVSSSTASGSYSSSSGTWSIPTLASGATATLTLTGNVAALGTLTNTATIVSEDETNSNVANNVASTAITAVEQHYNVMVSDASNSQPAVVVESMMVSQSTPWDSVYSPIVLSASGGQTYQSATSDFSVAAGSQYAVALELLHGSTGQSLTLNGYISDFADVINPASLSGATDSRYGTSSDWSGGVHSMGLASSSAEGLTAVITAGASSSDPGSVLQSATASIDSNTISNSTSAVDFLYGTASRSTSLTITGSGSGNEFIDAASNSTHHYTIIGGAGDNVIIYNSEDASIKGGTSSTAWNSLTLYGNDSISLNTTSNVTTATTTGGISGGTQLSNISILNISGYAVDGSGNPVVSDGTVGTGSNTVTLHANDILNMSNETFANLVSLDPAFNQLTGQPGIASNDKVMLINGASTNTVTFAEGNWTSVGTVEDSQGHSYTGYVHVGTNGTEALALISTDITHIVGHT